MRLLLAALAIMLTPSGGFLLTQRALDRSEGEFWEDSHSQVERLNRVIALYPPNVRKMRNAPAIMQLKNLSDGGQVASTVCYSAVSAYGQLFERLSMRCAEWTVVRRARRYALGALVLSVFMLGAVLTARIVIRRALALGEWPGQWSYLYAKHGVSALLLGHIAVSSVAYWILLRDKVSSPVGAWAILLPSIAIAFWLERYLVVAFVDTKEISGLRPTRTVSGGGSGAAPTAGSPSSMGTPARRRRGLANSDRTVWPSAAPVKPNVVPPPHSPESAES